MYIYIYITLYNCIQNMYSKMYIYIYLDAQPWWNIDSELPVIMGISLIILKEEHQLYMIRTVLRVFHLHSIGCLVLPHRCTSLLSRNGDPDLQYRNSTAPIRDVSHPFLDKLGMVYYNYIINFITIPLS